jgi:hypothetical protein
MVVVVMPVTQPFGWLRQEGGQFKASLGNLGKLYLKKKFFFLLWKFWFFVSSRQWSP